MKDVSELVHLHRRSFHSVTVQPRAYTVSLPSLVRKYTEFLICMTIGIFQEILC